MRYSEEMQQESAYKILKGTFGAEKAAAFSKIFAIEHNIPEEREPVVAEIVEKMGIPRDIAAKLVDAFLERQRLQ